MRSSPGEPESGNQTLRAKLNLAKLNRQLKRRSCKSWQKIARLAQLASSSADGSTEPNEASSLLTMPILLITTKLIDQWPAN